jgi:hypothetical protein
MFNHDAQDIVTSADVKEIAVASTATIYTKAVRLNYGEYFALMYMATSDGNVKLQIQLQQSHKAPDSEGASEAEWIIPTSMSDIESALADEVWHIKTLSPITLPYARLKITGLAAPSANHASTTIQAKIGILGGNMNIGPSVDTCTLPADATEMAVAGNVTYYTKSFPLVYAKYFAVAYKATSSGVIDLTITLEQSYARPTTEGSSDTKYVTGSGVSAIHTNLADTTWHSASLSPLTMPFGRFKIAGGATNDASTTLQIKLSKQEQI